MELIQYTGGGVLEPTQDQIEEYIPNPYQIYVRQLESGIVELSFMASNGGTEHINLEPRAQVRIARLLLDCLNNQGLGVQ